MCHASKFTRRLVLNETSVYPIYSEDFISSTSSLKHWESRKTNWRSLGAISFQAVMKALFRQRLTRMSKNVKFIKCTFLKCLSPLFVLYHCFLFRDIYLWKFNWKHYSPQVPSTLLVFVITDQTSPLGGLSAHSLLQALGQWGQSKKRAGDRKSGLATSGMTSGTHRPRAWNRLISSVFKHTANVSGFCRLYK